MGILLRIALGLGVLLLGSAIVPVDRTNPPESPKRDMLEILKPPTPVAKLIQESCADCHSHRTRWPWYTRFYPASTMTAEDVTKARKSLNLSEWVEEGQLPGPKQGGQLLQMCAVMQISDMPPKRYVFLHPEAELTPEEKKLMCDWAKPAAKTVVLAAAKRKREAAEAAKSAAAAKSTPAAK